MTAANERQVGGSHYRKVPGEQHWDRLVRLKGLDRSRAYFTGTITAYVERYEDKNGIQDLEKARHYLDKLIELEQAEAARRVAEIDDRAARLAAEGPTSRAEIDPADDDMHADPDPRPVQMASIDDMVMAPARKGMTAEIDRQVAGTLVRPTVQVNERGVCGCTCGTPCPLGRWGMEVCCTAAELLAAGVNVVHASKETV